MTDHSQNSKEPKDHESEPQVDVGPSEVGASDASDVDAGALASDGRDTADPELEKSGSGMLGAENKAAAGSDARGTGEADQDVVDDFESPAVLSNPKRLRKSGQRHKLSEADDAPSVDRLAGHDLAENQGAVDGQDVEPRRRAKHVRSSGEPSAGVTRRSPQGAGVSDVGDDVDSSPHHDTRSGTAGDDADAVEVAKTADQSAAKRTGLQNKSAAGSTGTGAGKGSAGSKGAAVGKDAVDKQRAVEDTTGPDTQRDPDGGPSREEAKGTDSSGTDSSGTDSSGTDSSREDSSGTDSSGTDSSGKDASGNGANAASSAGATSTTDDKDTNKSTPPQTGASRSSHETNAPVGPAHWPQNNPKTLQEKAAAARVAAAPPVLPPDGPSPEPATAQPTATAKPTATAQPTSAAERRVVARQRLLAGLRQRPNAVSCIAAVLMVLIGWLATVQAQRTSPDQLENLSQTELIGVLSDLDLRSSQLAAEKARLQQARDQLLGSGDQQAVAREQARKRYEALAILAGTVPATGPGVVVTINDPQGSVRVPDLVNAIQELRDAGAEAMQINDHRVTVSTAFTGTPGQIKAGSSKITHPITIRAIGDAQTLKTALTFRGGMKSTIEKRPGAEVIIETKRSVKVSAVVAGKPSRFASPVSTAPAAGS